MNILFDTNILLIYGRDSKRANFIENQFHFFNGEHNLIISAVTLGELDSLSRQFQYGEKRRERLKILIEDLLVVDINIDNIIKKYGEIDAFSQGKLKDVPLNQSARNMGKNDLWIAATASVYNLTLVTTDKDFKHLSPKYLSLNYVDINKF